MKTDKQHDNGYENTQGNTIKELFAGIIDASEETIMGIIANKICRLADINVGQLATVNLKSRVEQHTQFYKRNLELIEDSNDENTAFYRFIDLGIKNPTQLNIYICQEKKNGKWYKTKVGLLNTLMDELNANTVNTDNDELEEFSDSTAAYEKMNDSSNEGEEVSQSEVQEQEVIQTEEQQDTQEEQQDTQEVQQEEEPTKQESVSQEEEKNEEITEQDSKQEEDNSTEATTNTQTEVSTQQEEVVEVVQQEDSVQTEEESATQVNNQTQEPVKETQQQEVKHEKQNENATQGKKGNEKMEENNKEQIINTELFKQESWNYTSNGQEVLKKYLQLICNIAINRQKERVITNTSNDTYLVNSGLLNRLGKDVYVTFRCEENGYIKDIEAVTSKSQLIKLGFTREDATSILESITPWINEEDVKFKINTIEEFELPEQANLKTLLSKLKNTCKRSNIDIEDDFTEDVLYDKIESSITRALAIYRRDKSYVIPVSTKNAKSGIAYAIPFDKTGLYMITFINEDDFAEVIDIMDATRVFTYAKVINPFLEKLS